MDHTRAPIHPCTQPWLLNTAVEVALVLPSCHSRPGRGREGMKRQVRVSGKGGTWDRTGERVAAGAQAAG